MKKKILLFVTLIIVSAFIVHASGGTDNSQSQLSQKASTAKADGEYGEAPILQELVNANELPRVENRLPKEPLVLEPMAENGEIGDYGGTLRIAYWNDGSALGSWASLLRVSPEDGSTIIPNLAKDFELSSDAKTLTLHLREGANWSDGRPFTADDFMFWYEDYALNEKLMPGKPKAWMPGGEFVRIERIDDYTVRFHFAVSYPLVLYQLASDQGVFGRIFLPKHYFSQFHPRYANEETLNELTDKAGHDEWWQLFKAKLHTHPAQLPKELNTPVMEAYVLKRNELDIIELERNPFYWKIDREGNQLPYLDKIQANVTKGWETVMLKVMNGEIDYARVQNLDDYPSLMENELQGGYKVLPWSMDFSAGTALFPNLTHKDPVMRKIIQDKRFRQALSLAINRNEINDAAYLGLGIPMQPGVVPPSPFYREEFAMSYAEYDPEKANQLLDEMNLEWDKNHKYRVRSDGETLSLTLLYFNAKWTLSCELTKEYWEAIGIETIPKMVAAGLANKIRSASEHDVGVFQTNGSELFIRTNPRDFIPTQRSWSQWGTLWAEWYLSGGTSGEEPVEEVKKLYDWLDTMSTDTDKAKRDEAFTEILRSQAENLWVIGTVGSTPFPVITNANLANVPEKAHFPWALRLESNTHPELWFYK